MIYVAERIFQLAQSRIPVVSSLAALSPFAIPNYARVILAVLSIDPGLWFTIALTSSSVRMLVRHANSKEKILKQYFGREWDVNASKRWRYIPFEC